MFKTLLTALLFAASTLAAQLPNPNLIHPFAWGIDNGETSCVLTTTGTTITFRPTITSGPARIVSFSQAVPINTGGKHQFTGYVDVPANATPLGPMRGWLTGGISVTAPANIHTASYPVTFSGGTHYVTFYCPGTTDPNVVYTIPQPRLELAQQAGPQVLAAVMARQFANSTVDYRNPEPGAVMIVGTRLATPLAVAGLGYGLEVDLTQPYATTTASQVSYLVPWGTLPPFAIQAVNLTSFGTTAQLSAF